MNKTLGSKQLSHSTVSQLTSAQELSHSTLACGGRKYCC